MTNNKYTKPVAIIFGMMFLFAVMYYIEMNIAKDEMKPIGLTQAQMEELSSRFEGDLGEPVTAKFSP